MNRNYNTVAPYYDFLAKLVYGNAFKKTQHFLAQNIPANSSILIVGGGTGQILEQVAICHQAGLRITYVDSSIEMIRHAMKKNCGDNKVSFVTEPVQNIAILQQFDVIVTAFFFDNFSAATAKNVFDKLDASLSRNGVWLHADFENSKNIFWQKLLLKIMYSFFRLVCNIEAKQLPAMDLLFQQRGYWLISSKSFYGKFIHAHVFKKKDGAG